MCSISKQDTCMHVCVVSSVYSIIHEEEIVEVNLKALALVDHNNQAIRAIRCENKMNPDIPDCQL